MTGEEGDLFPPKRGSAVFISCLRLCLPLPPVENLHYLEPEDAQESCCETDNDINGMQERKMKKVSEKRDV